MVRKALIAPVVVTLVTLLALATGDGRALTWFSWALIVVATLNWWAFAILYRIARKNPDLALLQHHSSISLVTALAGSGMAVIAGNYLLGNPLPRGIGLALLLIVLLILSLRQPLFLLDYYRGKL